MTWVNGVAHESIAISDRGLLYGDGVWETIAVINGKPHLLAWHLERLQQGLQTLAIPFDALDKLEQQIKTVAQPCLRAVVKVVITRGEGMRGYNPQDCSQPTCIVQCLPWSNYSSAYQAQGIRLTLCQTRLAYQPLLAGFKHLNRLEQILARREFTVEFQEGLVRDYAGHVIEGTMSNLFIIRQDNTVLTPDLSGCGIAGVMRRQVLKLLTQLGVKWQICHVNIEDIDAAQALFMTNSLIGIWFVREFRERCYTHHPLIQSLQHLVYSANDESS